MPTSASSDSASTAPARAAAAVRWFGRFQLLRLLGKSERTMAWRVADSRSQQELLLVLPRAQLASAEAQERWNLSLRQAARLNHPQLAGVVEAGIHEGWPFVAYDPRDCATLTERLPRQGLPGMEAADVAAQLMQGLAFAHQAGIVHHDLQPYLVLLSDSGQVRLAGLAVASDMAIASRAAHQPPPTELGALHAQREAAERDVLAGGLLLHAMLTGQAVLDEADISRVIGRLAPYCGPAGRDIVRLPWTVAHPVAEPLRIIVNRATDRQERQRYRSARTFVRALEGWRQTEAATGGGPLALLADRLRSVGVLPSSPGAAARAARLALIAERERTNELAEVVLEDLALSFELLRLVNSAQLRHGATDGSGVVLTVRRAIAMLGLEGVRRAALSLREWPGPLADTGAAELQALSQRCKQAARLALSLRPAGYDAEVVYLVTLLQNLGRLVVQYHFAEEAVQIRRLMQAGPATRPGEAEDPGMTEEAASFAVLGADTEAIGSAVARHWGLDDSVLAMVRRQPLATQVRVDGDDGDMLRLVASCANEAMDALQLPQARTDAALQRVFQRYGRAMNFTVRDLQNALHSASHDKFAEPLSASAASSAPTKTGQQKNEVTSLNPGTGRNA